jgi:hypothetical protein
MKTHNTKPTHVRCRNLYVTYSETSVKEETRQDEIAVSQRSKQNRQYTRVAQKVMPDIFSRKLFIQNV